MAILWWNVKKFNGAWIVLEARCWGVYEREAEPSCKHHIAGRVWGGGGGHRYRGHLSHCHFKWKEVRQPKHLRTKMYKNTHTSEHRSHTNTFNIVVCVGAARSNVLWEEMWSMRVGLLVDQRSLSHRMSACHVSHAHLIQPGVDHQGCRNSFWTPQQRPPQAPLLSWGSTGSLVGPNP